VKRHEAAFLLFGDKRRVVDDTVDSVACRVEEKVSAKAAPAQVA
jgi:hypothetical protein